MQGGNPGGALIVAAERGPHRGCMTLAEIKELVDSKIAYNLSGKDLFIAMPK